MAELTETSSSAYALKQWIDQQELDRGSGWLATLEERKREEAEFHDADREDHRDEELGEKSSRNRRFYDAAEPATRALESWLRERSPGRVLLDYACGGGRQTLSAAQAGAALAVGIDISQVSVQNARETAQRLSLSDRTRFLQRDCEDTGLPDNSIDLCLCSGMLHHLDLSRAFPELHRILAPGGEIFCLEALEYNPAIRLYRRMTPDLRTEWEKEHILGLKDLRYARNWFNVEDIRYYVMAAPLATFLPQGRLRRTGISAGHMIDRVLTRLPGVQLWSWMFTFRLVKPHV